MNNERGTFFDAIQKWFSQKSKFWAIVSFFTFTAIITLQIFFIFLAEINSQIRQEIDSFLIPLLALFVFSIFWRGSVQTFLSFGGAMSVYGGMSLAYTIARGLQTLPPIVANRLGYGNIAAGSPTEAVASMYFLGGIIGLFMCILISFKPSFFKAKGMPITSSYAIWKNEDDPKLALGPNVIRLVPVYHLLSVSECYHVAKYRYIVVMIGGRKYFVSPDDWVPQGSSVIREKESGLLCGILKVADGFNQW